MTLILMRHATRDFSDNDALSAEGHRLAATLAQVLRNQNHIPTTIFSSPKSRTRATLRPLSEELGLEIKIDPRLDERDIHESAHSFAARVALYCEEATSNAELAASRTPGSTNEEVWLACSHLDWLELAVQTLESDENDFEKSEPWPPMSIRFYVFEDGIWKREQRKS